MTKTLESLFNLPEDEEVDLPNVVANVEPINEDTLSTLDKITNSLPKVKGLEASDQEMDDLAEMATNSYKDLMELGFNVEPKYSSEIFNSASAMLGHAITAKNAKINKKLKQIELLLKKAQIDAKVSAKSEDVNNTSLGEGKALDRNELLSMLKNMK